MAIWKKLFESRKETKKLKQIYAEEISRKEREIAELKKDNQLLIKNAMGQAGKRQEMEEKCRKLLEINKKLIKKAKAH